MGEAACTDEIMKYLVMDNTCSLVSPRQKNYFLVIRKSCIMKICSKEQHFFLTNILCCHRILLSKTDPENLNMSKEICVSNSNIIKATCVQYQNKKVIQEASKIRAKTM